MVSYGVQIVQMSKVEHLTFLSSVSTDDDGGELGFRRPYILARRLAPETIMDPRLSLKSAKFLTWHDTAHSTSPDSFGHKQETNGRGTVKSTISCGGFTGNSTLRKVRVIILIMPEL
jgi:hypothetical protein